MSNPTVSGSCLCGAVRFRVRLPSLFCGHCHCSMCRRNHGAGFVTWFAVPRAQLEMDSGQDQLRRYSSSEHGSRAFCRVCGSSLFCESEKHPDRVDIPLANVDGLIDRAPQSQRHEPNRLGVVSLRSGALSSSAAQPLLWALSLLHVSQEPWSGFRHMVRSSASPTRNGQRPGPAPSLFLLRAWQPGLL